MGVLTLFSGGRDQAEAPVLLVVGVHREERAFGEAVAARLPASRFDLLRIEQGLSGRRPGPDELDIYRWRHRALYEQILGRIKPAHRVVLDLHTGFDEAGPCADVLCADTRLLCCIERGAGGAPAGLHPANGKVRGVRLVAGRAATDQSETADSDAACERQAGWPWLRPDMPSAVWCPDHHLYVGVEVYLPGPGPGTSADAEFGAAAVSAAAECGLRLSAVREQPAVR